MANVIRAYGFPVCNLVSVIGITVCSLWFSGWFGNAEKDYVKEFNSNEKDSTKHIKSASVAKVTSYNIVKFTTPIPYTAISLTLGVIGGFGSLRNQHKIILFP